MPPPIKVELLPHDPAWLKAAEAEARRLMEAFGAGMVEVHHVGSTAIPGIVAKPVLDLMPVVTRLADVDARETVMMALGYEGWGELGLPGRRYFTLSDKVSGRRLAQLHCFEAGSPEITRHLAFRDWLNAHPEEARAYEREKLRCQALHPDSSHDYGDCKSPWIKEAEARALEWWHRGDLMPKPAVPN